MQVQDKLAGFVVEWQCLGKEPALLLALIKRGGLAELVCAEKQLKGACLCMQKLFWTGPTEVLVPQ